MENGRDEINGRDETNDRDEIEFCIIKIILDAKLKKYSGSMFGIKNYAD
jgi:hypothetical protein